MSGTLPGDTVSFGLLVLGKVIIVGALNFFPDTGAGARGRGVAAATSSESGGPERGSGTVEGASPGRLVCQPEFECSPDEGFARISWGWMVTVLALWPSPAVPITAGRHATWAIDGAIQASLSANIRSLTSASSWNGEGVMRRRSVPRGTVG